MTNGNNKPAKKKLACECGQRIQVNLIDYLLMPDGAKAYCPPCAQKLYAEKRLEDAVKANR